VARLPLARLPLARLPLGGLPLGWLARWRFLLLSVPRWARS
jgi:hypothetical protein